MTIKCKETEKFETYISFVEQADELQAILHDSLNEYVQEVYPVISSLLTIADVEVTNHGRKGY